MCVCVCGGWVGFGSATTDVVNPLTPHTTGDTTPPHNVDGHTHYYHLFLQDPALVRSCLPVGLFPTTPSRYLNPIQTISKMGETPEKADVLRRLHISTDALSTTFVPLLLAAQMSFVGCLQDAQSRGVVCGRMRCTEHV